jgi:hypothetical protein
LIRPNASSRDPSATEQIRDRPSRHVEFRANASQRQAGLVQPPGSIEVDIGAVPNLSAGSSDDRGRGTSIDTELSRERVRRLPGRVAPHDLGTSRIGQPRLFLAERWDGSMGHPITSLTRENAA